jgi:zinc transport system substrate-binding protein
VKVWFDLKRAVGVAALAAILAYATAGCAGPDPDVGEGERVLRITVSIVPQRYFVERIGGDHVKVSVMAVPGANPVTYEPKPEQIEALSRADAYVAIGVPFEEAWMERIRSANERMMIVDTTRGIERMPMAAHHHQEVDLEDADEGLDPHIWLSPRLVKVQARTIYDALVRLDPDHQAVYKANLDGFLADIDQLDTDIRETLSGVGGARFIVFHPSWGYLARDYGLEMIAIEIEGKEPSAFEMAELIAEAKAGGIKVVFAQPEFSTQSAETIAREIDGEVLTISPLALEWPENLRKVADTFASALDR